MSNLRIDSVLRKSQLLYDDKWCQLRRVISPEEKIFGYTFIHEIRCNGEIISILPYRVIDEGLEFLFRKEATPCWELGNPILSSLTGGIDKNSNKTKTALKELEEESGYKAYDDELIYLGTSYASKSASTTYHLFSINLTDKKQTSPLYIETELETSSTCEWGSYDTLLTAQDPFIFVSYVRLMDFLFKK